MVDDNELGMLRGIRAPSPRPEARASALDAAMDAYALKKSATETQGSVDRPRLTGRLYTLWRHTMQTKLIGAPALAGLAVLPIAGYATFHLIEGMGIPVAPERQITETGKRVQKPLEVAPVEMTKGETKLDADTESRDVAVLRQPRKEAPASPSTTAAGEAAPKGLADSLAGGATTAPVAMAPLGRTRAVAPGDAMVSESQNYAMPAPEPMPEQAENRDRFAEFKTNPVRTVTTDPVSTFSIDVDTASYAFVRRSLKEGVLPQPDTVRVEEMVNYFPYDWKGPQDASTPFNTTVTVMPTPWNEHTRLMHVAIQGYDVTPAEQPRANLVFLLDVSGSMNEPDKLPLLQSAFRLLVSKLNPEDTVSIVTYAGNAGTVLEPTKVSEREKILSAIDTLTPGGSTAGEAGLREAYRLAQQSFVKDGINRVMLATDGDFNVGQTDDADLKRMIEEKRKTGVFLSVFGFGRGNLNDQMMQTIAQNGNGTAAYIDTLAEAEKVLVEDASSTLFPIAKDVKIQVEFNPAKVSEYRLIGYETRALNREDFNNDKVDAGEIGSGHSVTAIYEVTPKGGPQQVDDLRYGAATTDNQAGIANADEYAFVKIRYKRPNEDVSKLITSPIGEANVVSSFDVASADQRFSIAVAAFGQKLRKADATDGMSWERIGEIATAARGADPFGYRAEFLSLVRLASALDRNQ